MLCGTLSVLLCSGQQQSIERASCEIWEVVHCKGRETLQRAPTIKCRTGLRRTSSSRLSSEGGGSASFRGVPTTLVLSVS